MKMNGVPCLGRQMQIVRRLTELINQRSHAFKTCEYTLNLWKLETKMVKRVRYDDIDLSKSSLKHHIESVVTAKSNMKNDPLYNSLMQKKRERVMKSAFTCVCVLPLWQNTQVHNVKTVYFFCSTFFYRNTAVNRPVKDVSVFLVIVY